jgi:MFS family permease
MTISKFGPVRTEAGVTAGNMWTLMFAAFVSIGMVTGMAAITPYVLTTNLGIAEADQGKALGLLAFWQEVVLILIYSPLGVFADRFGRKIIYILGFVTLGIGYIVYPFAETLTELSFYRIIYAIGIGAVTGMFATIIADYAQTEDRGKLTAILGFLNGLGIVCVTLSIGKLPAVFVGDGATDLEAGRYAMWVAAGLCFFSALILTVGLKGHSPGATKEKKPFMAMMGEGFGVARTNKRIALSYAAAFVARGDVAIVGLFAIAWGKQAAIADGLSASEALAAGTIPFVIAQSAALLWPAAMAVPLDRWPRLVSLGTAMMLGALGYCLLYFVDDPLGKAAIPFFILLGIGQISAFLGAQTTISKEAPDEMRGSIIGAFNFCGAVGILVLTALGGWLFDHVGPWAPFMIVGILNGIVGLLAFSAHRAEKHIAAALA